MSVVDSGIVLKCTVNDWQEQKLFGGLRKIVTYLVTVTKHGASADGGGGAGGGGAPEQFCAPVRRRYSDFDWLMKIINLRYRGTWQPPMPEKNVINTAEAFIKDRMSRLDQFLNRLLSNPYMRHDTALNAFLTLSAGRAWDRAKKDHEKAEQSVRDVNNLQFARPPKISLSRGLSEWCVRACGRACWLAYSLLLHRLRARTVGPHTPRPRPRSRSRFLSRHRLTHCHTCSSFVRCHSKKKQKQQKRRK